MSHKDEAEKLLGLAVTEALYAAARIVREGE